MTVLRFGVIGSGDEAFAAYQAISAAGNAEVTVVGGEDLGSLQGMEELLSAHLATDHDQVWEGGHVDAVYIAHPAGSREQLVRDALSAGKHVLMPWPLAIDVAEGDRLLEARASAGVALGLAAPWPIDPAMASARMLVQAGVVGEITSWTVTRLYEQPFPDPMSMATSELALFRYISGLDATEVYARLSSDASVVSLLVTYRNGCLGTCHVGTGLPGGAGAAPVGLRVIGTEGQIDLGDEPRAFRTRSSEDAPARVWHPVRYVGPRGDLQAVIERFAERTLAGEVEPMGMEEMLQPMRIIAAAVRSLAEDASVPVAG